MINKSQENAKPDKKKTSFTSSGAIVHIMQVLALPPSAG